MSALRRWLPALTGILLVACRSAVPEQKISRQRPELATTAGSLLGGPWRYHPAPRRFAYVVDQHALLTTRTDTVIRIDSVRSHAALGFTLLSEGRRISGSITVFRVRAPGQISTTPRGLTLPLPFAGEYPSSARQVEFTTPTSAQPCASPATEILHSLRDLWFRPPDTLRLRGTWTDTSRYQVCRDGIVLHASVRRTFRVASAGVRDGRVLLTVVRSSYGTLEGAGRQFGESVEIAGTSSGQLTYELDPQTGELLDARGTSSLELTLKSHLRAQVVRQLNELDVHPGSSVNEP